MSPTDAELYEQAAENGEAFGLLYDRYERPLLAYFMQQTRNPEVAADLTAETFAALLAARRNGTPIEQPRAWLYGVGRRKLIDAFRKGVVDDAIRKRLKLERLELGDSALREIEALASDEAAVAQLAALPGEQRSAVIARIIEDQPYEQIALDLGCSEAVVRKRVSRGLTFLRRRLQEQQT